MTAPPLPRLLRFLCRTRDCSESGAFIHVDEQTARFAMEEKVQVLCPGCLRPLVHIPRTTTPGARP